MEKFYAIIIGSIVVESLVEIVKGFVNKDKTPNFKLIGSAILGILLSFNCNFDILNILGLENTIPYLGVVCTGIIISRGSNVLHDLIKKIMDVAHMNDNDQDEVIEE